MCNDGGARRFEFGAISVRFSVQCIKFCLVLEAEIRLKAEEEARLMALEEAKQDEIIAQRLVAKGWAVGKLQGSPTDSKCSTFLHMFPHLSDGDSKAPASSTSSIASSVSPPEPPKKKGSGGRPKGSVGKVQGKLKGITNKQVELALEQLFFRY